jgi:ABC-2 type transport system permease protein
MGVKMAKIWHIIKYEYTRHVFRKRFLFSLLSLPVGVLLMFGVAFLIGNLSIDRTPVGYVDHSGVLQDRTIEEDSSDIFDPQIEFRSYQNQDQAEQDLDEGIIQAYYVLPSSYPQTLEVELFFLEEPDGAIQSQFENLVSQNLSLFEDLDPQVKERLSEGSVINMQSLDGSREMRQDQWYLILIPFVAGIMLVVVIMTSGGYLLQAVVEEKENRTMEIVITSVSPSQLMTGKIIGNIGVGLTQLVVWLVFGWVGLRVAGQFWPVLQDFSLPSDYIAVLLLVLLPSFVMVAAFMAAIGATMTELREAQQVQGLISLPMMVPYYIATSIIMNPNSTLAVVLSYFPLTSPITLIMRMSFTVIPTWQLALNIAILFAFAIFAIWFAGRAFRMGMLRYGKKLSIKEVLGKGVNNE